MAAELIGGAIEAVATLTNTIITHLDKDPETRRQLNVQDTTAKLDDLGKKITLLIQSINQDKGDV